MHSRDFSTLRKNDHGRRFLAVLKSRWRDTWTGCFGNLTKKSRFYFEMKIWWKIYSLHLWASRGTLKIMVSSSDKEVYGRRKNIQLNVQFYDDFKRVENMMYFLWDLIFLVFEQEYTHKQKAFLCSERCP